MFFKSCSFGSQPAARPPAQKAKSPAPQAPGGPPSVKLGPKGEYAHSQTP